MSTVELHGDLSTPKDESVEEPAEIQITDLSRLAPHGKYYEWITNISVQKHCLGGPFGVHIFLGDVPTDPLSWLTHENNVGEFFVLASDTAHSGCDKCKKDEEAEVQVRGIVPLTSTLTEFVVQGSLGSLEPADVVPYLIKHMHWRVAFVDGTEKPLDEVAHLQVSVVSTEVMLPTELDPFPVYSDKYTIHPEITEGKVGGYQNESVTHEPLSRQKSERERPSSDFLSHNDYTVACICSSEGELAAVEGMLDEIHKALPSSHAQNRYTLGRIRTHNIVVAVMPAIDNRAVMQLLENFQSIRFTLSVGIGVGVPGEKEDDIRLGDVVVSKPTATFGGVVQYNIGKVAVGGILQRTGTLKPPPTVLVASVHRLEAQQIRSGSQIPKYLEAMLKKYPNMRKEQYVYQGEEHDQLFEATYDHMGGTTCRDCDQTKVRKRPPRHNTDPKIHYGTIGSVNMVIKDKPTWERLRKDLGVLCIETEAAGLMDEFSCLVIRGIYGYADSHKNDRWQPYAAATAAAYAKELLSIIPA